MIKTGIIRTIIQQHINVVTMYVCYPSSIQNCFTFQVFCIFPIFFLTANYIQYNMGSSFLITPKGPILQIIYHSINTFFQIIWVWCNQSIYSTPNVKKKRKSLKKVFPSHIYCLMYCIYPFCNCRWLPPFSCNYLFTICYSNIKIHN